MKILVLGAGFGGLELTTKLSEEFGDVGRKLAEIKSAGSDKGNSISKNEVAELRKEIMELVEQAFSVLFKAEKESAEKEKRRAG